MIRSFLLISISVCCAAEAQDTNDVVRFRVTVLDVAPLRAFTGSLIPTGDVDPRFALTVRVDSCVPAIINLKSGTVVTFAVHSPSRFLGGSAEKGKAHEITIPRKKALNSALEDQGNANATAVATPRMKKEEVVRIAKEAAARERHDLENYDEPDAVFHRQSNDNTWSVIFWRKNAAPEDTFLVKVNDRDETAKVVLYKH